MRVNCQVETETARFPLSPRLDHRSGRPRQSAMWWTPRLLYKHHTAPALRRSLRQKVENTPVVSSRLTRWGSAIRKPADSTIVQSKYEATITATDPDMPVETQKGQKGGVEMRSTRPTRPGKRPARTFRPMISDRCPARGLRTNSVTPTIEVTYASVRATWDGRVRKARLLAPEIFRQS